MSQGLPKFAILPTPIEDEHILSLVHGYMRLNCLNPWLVFRGVSKYVLRNMGFNYYYVKAARIFAASFDEATLFERNGFERLRKPFVPEAYHRSDITGARMAAPTRGKLADERRHWVHSERHLLFCPECRAHDLEYHGYARWRTSHQIRGVLVCPDHGYLLTEACPQCRFVPGNVTQPEVNSTACVHCGCVYPIEYPARPDASALLLFARFIQALLKGKIASFEPKLMVEVLTDRAMEQFCIGEAAVPARLRREIEKTFPADLLSSLGLSLRIGGSAGWLRWFFARLAFIENFHAHALISAVLFRSLGECLEAYAHVAGMHGAVPKTDSVAYVPITAYLLKDLAWQSSLKCVSGSRVLECIPGLERVRQSRFIKAKETMLPLLQQAIHQGNKTKSKLKVNWALYEAEQQVMLRKRQVLLSASTERPQTHPDSMEQRAVSTCDGIGVDGIEAHEEVAETHP